MKRCSVYILLLCASAVTSGQGWEGGKPQSKPTAPAGQLSAADQTHYDAVATAIVAALAAGDLKALQALFTPDAWASAIDWWHAGFALQIERFGPIERAFAPRRGFIRTGETGVRGDERNGATFLVHFERAGAALSFELNDAGKIVHSSCWVQEALLDAVPDEVPPIYPPKVNE
jgi:hypothetical protein